MIGARVTWRHKNDEGTGPAVQLEGEIIALERGGTPARWEALVLRDDGTMQACEPTNLVITARPTESDSASNALNMVAPTPDIPADALGQYELLAAYLNTEWGETMEDHDSAAKHAVALIEQLKQELMSVGGEREKLRKDVERLEGFVAELKKKPKKSGQGPAGPAAKSDAEKPPEPEGDAK